MAGASSDWGFGEDLSDWERREYSSSSGADGTSDEGEDEDACEEESENEDEAMSQEEASSEFLNMLIALKHQGVLSAKHACSLSFWAKKGGIVDPGGKLAVNPACRGGDFSKKFDKVLGIHKELQSTFYTMPLVVHRACLFSREEVQREVKLAHESLSDEVGSCPDFWSRVEKTTLEQGWKPAFDSHPVVRTGGPKMSYPLAIYIDGVAFLKRDSCIGMWIVNLATGRRHVTIVLRKRELCRCACKGWCTIYGALDCLKWQLAYLARGELPPTRHDGAPWVEGSYKQFSPGQAFGWKAVVVMVKADWAEYAHTMAYRSWAHHEHPCFLCDAKGGPGGNLHTYEGWSTTGMPFAPKTARVYDDACRALERTVTIPSLLVLHDFVGRLEFDQKKGRL